MGFLSRIAFIALCLLLAGCQRELYTNLPERDANQMLAILTVNGIAAGKEYIGDAGVSLLVGEDDMARAIDILNQNGFPREERETLGKVFQKSGIMSSPFEEHVRYMYALAEEVSKTLNAIDGVLLARVHIVIPQSAEFDAAPKPASAAVFIKYRPGVDLDFLTPQIRRLVSNSIEGVKYEDVTVVLVAAEAPQLVATSDRASFVETINGIGIRATDAHVFWQSIFAVGTFLVALIVSNLVCAFFFFRTKRSLKRAQFGDLQGETSR